MPMDVIYEEHGSDWSHQVSAVVTTWWLQHDQTLRLSAKGVACETRVSDDEDLSMTCHWVTLLDAICCVASITSSHLKKFGVQSSPTLSLSALASLWIWIKNILSYSLCNHDSLIPRLLFRRNSLGMRLSLIQQGRAGLWWFVGMFVTFLGN